MAKKNWTGRQTKAHIAVTNTTNTPLKTNMDRVEMRGGGQNRWNPWGNQAEHTNKQAGETNQGEQTETDKRYSKTGRNGDIGYTVIDYY